MGQQDFTRWQAGYSVGNWMLDNQHKVLLSLCKQTLDCVSDDGLEFVGQFSLFRDDLLDSLDAHCRSEENLLSSCAYPLLAQHKEEHRESQSRLNRFLLSASAGETGKAELHELLAQWWMHHIVESDKQFAGAIQRVR